jgi:hypothetical protein
MGPGGPMCGPMGPRGMMGPGVRMPGPPPPYPGGKPPGPGVSPSPHSPATSLPMSSPVGAGMMNSPRPMGSNPGTPVSGPPLSSPVLGKNSPGGGSNAGHGMPGLPGNELKSILPLRLLSSDSQCRGSVTFWRVPLTKGSGSDSFLQ